MEKKKTVKEEKTKANTISKKKKGSAWVAGAVYESPTNKMNPHTDESLAKTGTNISYEEATAPGGGGSVGTGYASGKPADDEVIDSETGYELGRLLKVKTKGKATKDVKAKSKNAEIGKK